MTRIRPGLQWSDGAAGPVLTALASDEPRGWQDFAACTGTDGDAFFPEIGGSTREAKRVCAVCPVRSDCLAYALEQDIRFGVWGGLSEQQRSRLRAPAVHVPRPVAVTAKRCSGCGQTKSSDDFYRNRGRHDGLDSWCSACAVARDPRKRAAA